MIVTLERLILETAGSGEACLHAIRDLRGLLRRGIPEIVAIEAQYVPRFARCILETLQTPPAREIVTSSAVKRVLKEAHAHAEDLAFGDAARVLAAQVTQMENENRERDSDLAILLARRGWVACLQLRYHEAAAFYTRAAKAVAAFDQPSSCRYALAAAQALLDQGTRFGDSQALLAAFERYSFAAELAPRDRAPLDWATTQNGLGNALQTLGLFETGTACLEEAVAAYRAGLVEASRDRAPLNWAVTQRNLGAALQKLGMRESGTASLEEAVTAYRAALEEWRRDREPFDWATTQDELGTALEEIGDRKNATALIEEAVATHRLALKELTRNRNPLDWARAKYNLGNALHTLGMKTGEPMHLEEAVAAYRTILDEGMRNLQPIEWAATQNNLGSALVRLGEREAGTAHLEEAVAAYRAALEERKHDRISLAWAWTQVNLGYALSVWSDRESGTAHLEEAAMAYDTALSAFEQAQADDNADLCRTTLNCVVAQLVQRARRLGFSRVFQLDRE
jgi:tetratricopeptide (TPR) repeat protein